MILCIFEVLCVHDNVGSAGLGLYTDEIESDTKEIISV